MIKGDWAFIKKLRTHGKDHLALILSKGVQSVNTKNRKETVVVLVVGAQVSAPACCPVYATLSEKGNEKCPQQQAGAFRS